MQIQEYSMLNRLLAWKATSLSFRRQNYNRGSQVSLWTQRASWLGLPPGWATSSGSQPYIRYLGIGYIISDYFWEIFVCVKSYFKLGAKDTEIFITSHKVQQTFLAKTPSVFSKVGVNGAQWMEKDNKKRAGRENVKICELS